VSTLTREITFLDLASGRERTGQWWSGAPLVTGRDAVWVVAYDTGRPVHVHRVAARHRDTRRALAGRPAPEYVTGVTTPYGTRHDLTRPGA
jgi:hypothetical protein